MILESVKSNAIYKKNRLIVTCTVNFICTKFQMDSLTLQTLYADELQLNAADKADPGMTFDLDLDSRAQYKPFDTVLCIVLDVPACLYVCKVDHLCILDSEVLFYWAVVNSLYILYYRPF